MRSPPGHGIIRRGSPVLGAYANSKRPIDRRERNPSVKSGMTILTIVLVAMLPGRLLAQDYNGQWLGTITESHNRCVNLGKAEPGDYKLTIAQKENDILFMENVVQRPYRGVLNPQRPRHVHVKGAYSVDGGYVTEMIDIVFASDERGAGESVWNWSDGYYQCGGRFKFELRRIRK
jgi:hypothetical protein